MSEGKKLLQQWLDHWPIVLVIGIIGMFMFWLLLPKSFLPLTRRSTPGETAGVILCWTMALGFLGIGLYALRRAGRLLYGIIEIGAALAIVFATVASLDQIINRGDAYFPWQNGLAFGLQVFAALYVFVRGMDNIGEGLKDYPSGCGGVEFCLPN